MKPIIFIILVDVFYTIVKCFLTVKKHIVLGYQSLVISANNGVFFGSARKNERNKKKRENYFLSVFHTDKSKLIFLNKLKNSYLQLKSSEISINKSVKIVKFKIYFLKPKNNSLILLRLLVMFECLLPHFLFLKPQFVRKLRLRGLNRGSKLKP